jgi:hypothetical protein
MLGAFHAATFNMQAQAETLHIASLSWLLLQLGPESGVCVQPDTPEEGNPDAA